MLLWIRLFSFVIGWLFLATVTADTLQEVLKQMQNGQTRHYQYREVRNMQFLEQEWISRGEMIIAREQMAIEQLKPRSILITINPSRILYLDRASGSRRIRAVSKQTSLPGIQPLILLFQSDNASSLKQHFDIRIEQQPARWLMTLTPKQGVSSGSRRVEVSGPHKGDLDHIKLYFKNGDSTEWFLSLQASGKPADQALAELLK
ncbi:MAG: hypothetical protein KZQ81_07010 [Candidatus Thiodiazotropha sp. (ex Rostrolucina anterorostrata)]|nr:hypothetical protein [Candidatus Thiodiazotropha sp. (ex Rostrolucina anterorostrata)]